MGFETILEEILKVELKTQIKNSFEKDGYGHPIPISKEEFLEFGDKKTTIENLNFDDFATKLSSAISSAVSSQVELALQIYLPTVQVISTATGLPIANLVPLP